MRYKPNCGIAGERERKKSNTMPLKGSNLMHSLACSQNKGLGKYQRRASLLPTGPFLYPDPHTEVERQVCDSQS